MKIPLPTGEAERLKALSRYAVLDTPPERAFDDITLLASHVCKTPIAMISFVDENRQWFKSKIGLAENETPRDSAFCAHGITQPDFFEVTDALTDERFTTNPLVTGNPGIRFYAGAPLVTPDRHVLGMLCVMDQVPRKLSATQKTMLQSLSRQVVTQLEARGSLLEARQTVVQLKLAKEELQSKTAFFEAQVHSSVDGIVVVDHSGKKILQNQRTADLLGIPRSIADDMDDDEQLRWVTNATRNPEQFLEKVAYLYAHPKEISRDEIGLKDGSILDRYSSPVVGQDGKYYGRIWTFRDITARKQTENALSESKRFAESITENSTNFIYLFDLETGSNAWSNRSVAEYIGYSQSQIRGLGDKFLSTISHPDDLPRIMQHYAHFAEVADNRVLDIEYRVRHNSGEWRWVWARDTVFKRRPNGAAWQIMGTAQDITERKEIEQALQRQQAELRVLFDLMPAMIWFKDTENGILRVNSRVAKAAGKSVEEIEGKPSLEVYPKEAARFYADDLEVIHSGAPKLGIVEMVLGSKGEEIWVRTDKVPYFDKDGKVIGIVVMAQDITERRRDEEALRHSEERFQLVSRATDDAIWDWNVVANTISFNESLGRLFGYRVGEFESTMDFWMNGIHPEDHDRILTSVHAFFASREEMWSGEYRFRCADGSYAFVYDRGYVVRDGEGKPLRMVGAMMNVTVQRRLEQELKDAKVAAALREGALRYSFLADTVPLIIWTARPDGGLDYYNKAWFDYTGLTLAETKDWGWEAVLHPDDRQNCFDRWTRSFTTGENYEIEYRFKRAADGAYRWHLGRALPMHDEQGQIVQWVGTCTDIDDAKRSKQTLQAANDELGLRVMKRTSELHLAKEAAEAANRAKSEFLANMSHEIRTPMNGVLGMTSLLLDTSLTEQQKNFAETIQFSGEALLTIVNDILDFSKIEAGKLELETIDIDLAHLMQGTLELLRGTAKSKGLELQGAMDPDTPVELRGDGGRLRQVLINLIGNAIKFTPRGKVKLHISVDRQTKEMAYLRFRITDTGIGIPLETQARLFQAFTQADGSTTRRYGGTGLGLVICKQLVEKMHGDIGVESSSGKGSIFWFTAEFRKQSEGVARIAPPETKETSLRRHKTEAGVKNGGLTRPQRVLIAEDNTVNQRVAAGQLKTLGYASDSVANGLEVLEALSRIPYDIILMDCQMPELDGYEATKQVRNRGGHQPYIIAMTASAMPGDKELCLAAGMDGYITKPVRTATLKAALEQYGESEQEEVASSSAKPEPAGPQPEPFPGPTKMSPSEEVLVNIDQLRDVTDNEPDRMQRLIDLYLAQAVPMLDGLNQAIQTNSSCEVARIAHKLVGSSLSCGVEAFTQPLRELERLGRGGDLAGAHALFDDIRHKFPRVQSVLTQLMPNPKLEVTIP